LILGCIFVSCVSSFKLIDTKNLNNNSHLYILISKNGYSRLSMETSV
jgi:hypothetical protein